MGNVKKNTEANIKKTFDWESPLLKVVLGIVVFIVVICVIPYTINCLILKQTQFDIVGDGTHWLSFWASYLAAIASFAMVFITWLTLKKSKEQNDAILKQNEDQLKEMKRQWEEDHRPKIEAYLIKGSTIADKREIEFVNIGASPAEDFIFHLDSQFIDGAPIEEKAKEALRKLGNATPAFLFPHETLSFSLYEKEYVPAGRFVEVYTIAHTSVDEPVFRSFEGYVSQYREIPIKGTYNKKYEIKTSVDANRTRYPYTSVSSSIDNVSNNIVGLNFALQRIEAKVGEETKDKK